MRKKGIETKLKDIDWEAPLENIKMNVVMEEDASS